MSGVNINMLKAKGKVYLAAGWFDEDQFNRLESVKNIIVELGYDIYSPKDEALCKPDSSIQWRKLVYESNVKAIRECSFMVAITDRLDCGTLHETGLASGLGKPIIYFAETLGDKPFNLMLAQSGVAVALSKEELKSLLSNDNVAKCIIDNTPYSEFSGSVE